MTAQQHADRLLLTWQANRHLPAAQRLQPDNDNGDAAIIAQMDRDLAAIAAEMSRPDRAFAAIMGFAP